MEDTIPGLNMRVPKKVINVSEFLRTLAYIRPQFSQITKLTSESNFLVAPVVRFCVEACHLVRHADQN